MLTINAAREQFIRTWIRKRFHAQTERDVSDLLRTVRPEQVWMVHEAIRATVEHQVLDVGRNRYEVEVFAIPMVVTSSGQFARSQLLIDQLIPTIGRHMKECRIAGSGPSGGVTMLTTLVAQCDLRKIDYADMYDIARDIFYSAVATPKAVLQKAACLRSTPDAFSDLPIDSGSLFVGHIVGCRYRKFGAERQANQDPVTFKLRLGELLQAHFATLSDQIDVRVGPLLSLYKSMEMAAEMSGAALLRHALSQCDTSTSTATIQVESDNENVTGNKLVIDIEDPITGTQSASVNLRFDEIESARIGEIFQTLAGELGWDLEPERIRFRRPMIAH